ncbi:plectin-like isoform X2 [Branchiostoma lanceolatum]|uniref:plectin-like isoform X2 n=1 Tax=Branchiostoma lanceolatum TaxID=7740 RepID=UPI00345601B5
MAALSVDDDDMMSGVGPLSSVPSSPAAPHHFSSPAQQQQQQQHGRKQQQRAAESLSPITTNTGLSLSPTVTVVSTATSQSARYPHVESFLSSSETPTTFIREMEGVRNSLQNMLKLGQAMADRDSFERTEGLGLALLTADRHDRKELDESFSSTTTTQLLTAKPVLVSQDVSPVSVDSGMHTARGQWSSRLDGELASERRNSRSESLYVENQILRDSVERERFRRKHCEQQIQELQSKILELQQQLAVAVSTDKKKDVMIEQLDKTLAKVVEGWKKQDTEKTDLIRKLKEEKFAIEKGHSRQQEVLMNFEKDLAQAVEQLAIEQQRASMAEQEKVAQFQKQQEEKAKTLDLLQGEREKAIRVESERDQLLQQREELQREVENFNQILETERSTLRAREEELHQQLDVLTEKHQEVVDQEKAAVHAESQKAQEHQKALSSAHNEISQLKMELSAADRDKENLKMELSLQEAKFEASQSKLEAEYQAEQERKMSQQLAEAHEQLTQTEEKLREQHRRQIQEVADRHRQDLDKHMRQFDQELEQKETKLRETCQDYDDRISEAREKMSALSRENNKLESQKNVMKTRLQALIQSHVKEAMLLLSDVTSDGLSSSAEPLVSSTFRLGAQQSVNNAGTTRSGLGVSLGPSMFSVSGHPGILDTTGNSVPWSTQNYSETLAVRQDGVEASGYLNQDEIQKWGFSSLLESVGAERLTVQRQEKPEVFAAQTANNVPQGERSRQATTEIYRDIVGPGERQPTAEAHRQTTAQGERRPTADVLRDIVRPEERQPSAEVHRDIMGPEEREATAEVHRHTTAPRERQPSDRTIYTHVETGPDTHVTWSPESAIVAETLGYTEQDIDDGASVVSTEPTRRMVESQYEPLLEKFNHHETKQSELQHYVELLLQQSPGGYVDVFPSQDRPVQENRRQTDVQTGPSSLAFLPPETVISPPTSARAPQVDVQAVVPSSLQFTNRYIPQQPVSGPPDSLVPSVPDKDSLDPQQPQQPPTLNTRPPLSTDWLTQLRTTGPSFQPDNQPIQRDVHAETGAHLNTSSQNLMSTNIPIIKSRLPPTQVGSGVSQSYPPMMASSPRVLPVSNSHKGTPSKDRQFGPSVVTRVLPTERVEGQQAPVIQRTKVSLGVSQQAGREIPFGSSAVPQHQPVWPNDPAMVQELLNMYANRSGQGYLTSNMTGHHVSFADPTQTSDLSSSRGPGRVKRSLSASFSQSSQGETDNLDGESKNAKSQSTSKVPPRTAKAGKTQVVKPTQTKKPERKVAAGNKADKKSTSAWR